MHESSCILKKEPLEIRYKKIRISLEPLNVGKLNGERGAFTYPGNHCHCALVQVNDLFGE
jgi:hypothetical protein